jgi:hypothetical protein
VIDAKLHFYYGRAEVAEKMAGERRRERQNEEALHLDKEEYAATRQRSNSSVESNQRTQQTGSIFRKGETPQKVKPNLTARRVRIDPEAKRAKYLNRLEILIQELDGVIIDPEGIEHIQLQAMDVLIKAVRQCYHIVRDIDVEMLEVELEEIKESNRRAKEKRGEKDLGYEIEEDSTK